ncbi:unnamed protein product [Caenorhabditis auriculariae]|uniref:PWWP domain-containing protein n=1 Tax=Caenorhabditis auriculariae TaxID=2777116 RepID=A0A8S1HUC0_9PELO|nr:unnamed protein product [Caenorhabditis auriculariae]
MTVTATGGVQKGDVIWVPYRKGPMWPALVQHVYPKKITYVFFPVPKDEGKKSMTFSSPPKAIFALKIDENLESKSSKELVEAFKDAVKYLKEKGIDRGSSIKSRDEEESEEQKSTEPLSPKKTEKPKTAEKRTNSDKDEAPEAKKSARIMTKLAPASPEKKLKAKEKPKKAKMEKSEASSASSEASSAPGVISRRTNRIPVEANKDSSGPIQRSTSFTGPLKPKEKKQLLENIRKSLDRYFKEHWKLSKKYTRPPLYAMNISFDFRDYFTEEDCFTVEQLVDRLLDLVKKEDVGFSGAAAIHFVAKILFPEIVIGALMETRSLDRVTAAKLYGHLKTFKKMGRYGEMVSGPLEALVQVACQERESLSE